MTHEITFLRAGAALALMSTTAMAGPPADAPTTTGAGDLVLDCEINGRLQNFAILGGEFSGNGIATMLADGVYSVTLQNGSTYVLDSTSAQANDGPDSGKWDCVPGTVPVAPTVAPPQGDPNAMAALQAEMVRLMAEVQDLQLALSLSYSELEIATAERDAALAAGQNASLHEQRADNLQTVVDDMRNARDAAMAEVEAERRRADELDALAQAAQGRIDSQGAELAALTAEVASLSEQLSEALAANAAMAAEAAAMHDMADDDMTEDDTADDDMTEDDMSEGDMASDDAMDEEMTDAAEDMAESDMSDGEEADMAEGDTMADPLSVEGFDPDAAMAVIAEAELSPISRAALTAAIDQARNDPALIAEVVARIASALAQ